MNNENSQLPNLEMMIALLPGNIYWKDRKGFYQGCNNSTAEFLHLKSREDIVGKTLYDLLPKEAADKITKIDESIMQLGKELSVEEELFNLQGELVTYFSRKVPLKNEDGDVIGLAGVSINITHIKRYEEALKNAKENDAFPDLEKIIEILPGNVYWKNREHIYLGCNDNMAKLIKLQSRHDYVGKTLYDFASKDIADHVTAIDEAIMESGKESCTEEEAFDTEGNPATYFSRKAPLKNREGKVIGLVGISIDITDRKRYESALRLAKEKAEVASKAKSNFIMNISHDIRTPFSGILGLSEFLSEKEDNPEKKDILESIVESSKNLLDILNEVISLAALEKKPDASASYSKIQIRDLVKDVFAIMRPEAKHKNLVYTLNIKPNVPTHVIGDEFGIKRVLLNLIGNAIKFTETGRIQIIVETLESTHEQIKVQFIVQDSGIGIPNDKLDKIFEQFSQVTPAHKGEYQGTGLGLWLVKQLLASMGGSIHVESEIDKGSRFIFIVPFSLQSLAPPKTN